VGGPRAILEVLRCANDSADGMCDYLVFQMLDAIYRFRWGWWC
jgi:hypothetical protein